MLRYMLDTDPCVRVIRDRPPAMRARFNAEAEGLCISSVTLMELSCGVVTSGRAGTCAALAVFAARLAVLPFEEDAAAHAGEIRATLERAGQVIGPCDLMIAGHARSRGLIVVTGNPREFTRVDGSRCVDWIAGGDA